MNRILLAFVLAIAAFGAQGQALLRNSYTTNTLPVQPRYTLPASLHFNGATKAWQSTNLTSGSITVVLTNIAQFVPYVLEVDSTGGNGTSTVGFAGFTSPGACLTNGVTSYLIMRVGSATNITMILPPTEYRPGWGVQLTTNSQTVVTISAELVQLVGITTNYTVLGTVGSPNDIYGKGTNELFTLPAASTCPRRAVIFHAASTSASLIITNANGSDTILGALSQTVSGTNRLAISSDGSNWW